MHFAPPTPSLDLPCAVPNFMAIPAVTANPHTRYTVYKIREMRWRKRFSRSHWRCCMSLFLIPLLRCHYSPKMRAVLVNRVIPVVILHKGMGYSLDSMGFTSLYEEAGGGVTITKLLKGYLKVRLWVLMRD